MLGPVSSHTAAETRQVVATLGSQPTVAGHSGDHPPDLETLRATPARPHQILIQGNLARPRLALLGRSVSSAGETRAGHRSGRNSGSVTSRSSSVLVWRSQEMFSLGLEPRCVEEREASGQPTGIRVLEGVSATNDTHIGGP